MGTWVKGKINAREIVAASLKPIDIRCTLMRPEI